MSRVTITINGTPESRDVEDRTLLVQFIREHVGLTGTHLVAVVTRRAVHSLGGTHIF